MPAPNKGEEEMHGTEGESETHSTKGESEMHGTEGESETHGTEGESEMHGTEGESERHDTDDRSGLIDGAKNSRSLSVLHDGTHTNSSESCGPSKDHDVSEKSCDLSANLASKVPETGRDTSDSGLGETGNLEPNNAGTDDYSGPGLTSDFSMHGLLPGIYATGGSETSDLPDALKWLQSSNGGENTDDFFYGLTADMSMTSGSNIAGIGAGAGTWGEENNLDMNAGGNWPVMAFAHSTSLVTNNASFTGMLYGPSAWPDTTGRGMTQHIGGEGQFPATPNILPPVSQPEEPRASSAGTDGSILAENANMLAHLTPVELSKAAEPRVPGEKSSRFGRTITPSTRLEKMNEIGSTKENVPIVAPRRSTEWVTSVKEHLSQCKFGEEWKLCVEGWLALEESLDFGEKTKASGHPHFLSES